jgi:hypothetical protein
MTIQPELFKAILAMDAYNRGYDAGINTLPSNTDGSVKIGSAKIIDDRGDTSAQAIGFYAVAYDYSGETIISYRGTDDPINGIWDVLTSQDVWNGWSAGTGSTESRQGEMAIQFYKELAGAGNYLAADISLIGHYLGGGLKRFRGSAVRSGRRCL